MDHQPISVIVKLDNVNVSKESVATSVTSVQEATWEKLHTVRNAVNVSIIGMRYLTI